MPEIKLRPLKTKDIFPISKILKKVGIKESLKNNSVNGNGKEAQTKIGFQIIMTALENLHEAEQEVNAFLADLTGMKPDEFSEMEFTDFLQVIEQFKQQKGISSFLEQATK